jgi:hypothetical protein
MAVLVKSLRACVPGPVMRASPMAEVAAPRLGSL